MKKKKFIQSALKYFPLLIIFFIITTLPFLGAECSNIINGNSSQANYFYDKHFVLQRQTGYLMDVCPHEMIILDKHNHARLFCLPYIDTVVRDYELDENAMTITFKLSLVAYKWEVKDSSDALCLNFYGINVGRNLFYQVIDTSAAYSPELIRDDKSTNSSEFIIK